MNIPNKIFSLSLIYLLASCSSLTPYKVPILQGNIFDEEDVEKLSEGLSKDQVQFIFGTALIQDPFHSDRWDYFYSIKIGNQNFGERKLTLLYDSENLLDSWNLEDAIDE